MLEKEFNPYEQALELREIGFNEGCIAFYNGKSLDWMIDDDNGLSYPTINPKKDVGECVKAPLWQQVWLWFTNKYSLFSNLNSGYDGREFTGFYFIIETKDGDYRSDYFDSIYKANIARLEKLIEFALFH